jgi:hypothetical protein
MKKNVALMGAIMCLVAAIAPAHAQNPLVDLTQFPKHLQFFARNVSTNAATIPIVGKVEQQGYDTLFVRVSRQNIVDNTRSFALVLVYDSLTAKANFSGNVSINAELKLYKIQLFLSDRLGNAPQPAWLDSTTIAIADSLVAGDVVLVQGQSNASSRGYVGNANSGYQSPYIRSFGYRGSDSASDVALAQTDLKWYIADGHGTTNAIGYGSWWGSGLVGQLPLIMAKNIIDTTKIPLCVINGAHPGRPITFFQRNDAQPQNINTNYGRLLYRTTNAGLAQAVRSIVYYQGEDDANNVQLHYDMLKNLKNDWITDYPNIQKIFIYQIKAGCGVYGRNPTIALRDAQRRFANDHNDTVKIMSTTALRGSFTDDCHFKLQGGNDVLGVRMANMIKQDLYNFAPNTQQFAPNPSDTSVHFYNAAHTQVVITMRTPDTLFVVGNPAADFVVQGLPSVCVTNVATQANKIILTLSGDASLAAGISYGGHANNNYDWIMNKDSIGLLSFYNLPIIKPLKIKAKVLLGGAYSPVLGSMTDNLRTLNKVPTTNPYNFMGYPTIDARATDTTTLALINANQVVDWVYVALRRAADSNLVYTAQPALLLRNGNIIAPNGDSLLHFVAPAARYFVEIRHRNHLSAMTAQKYNLTDTAAVFIDFTATQSYNNGQKMTGTKYTLIPGDANRDKQVNAADFNIRWLPQNGQSYNYYTSTADFNLDGQVNAADFNAQWLPNNSKQSQVP